MKRSKWIKKGIVCFAMITMLGTALLSFQAFTGVFPSDSASTGIGQNGEAATAGSGLPASVDSTTRSKDNKPESNGFLASPWIPVSYIRQEAKEASLSQQTGRPARDCTFLSYLSSRTNGATDRIIRNQSNSDYQIQALTLQISQLTAG